MISVVVIGKNEGPRLSACLQSIQDALRTLSYEIIYVDSRSDDDSIACAKSFGARCFLLTCRDTTAGLGRLVGTQEAQGEYLLFLDGDMQLRDGFVQQALLAISRGYDGVCGIRDDIYMQGGQVAARRNNYFGCTKERIAPEFGGAVFLTAHALHVCGGWSADTIACEEAELHARLIAAGLRIVELPVPMILHTDAIRDNRGFLRVLFSRRRLGEGQALRCAMAKGKALAYVRRAKERFLFYGLDWLSLLALLLGAPGLACACFLQAMQLGFLLSRGHARGFVSQKLFFFAFPAGLFTYHMRSSEHTPA